MEPRNRSTSKVKRDMKGRRESYSECEKLRGEEGNLRSSSPMTILYQQDGAEKVCKSWMSLLTCQRDGPRSLPSSEYIVRSSCASCEVSCSWKELEREENTV